MAIFNFRIVYNSFLENLIKKIQNLEEQSTLSLEVLEKIDSGELNIDFEHIDYRDKPLLKALIQTQKRIQDITMEEKKRKWVSEGLASFGEVLRDAPDLKALGDKIISKLVKHLDAVQGGLFVLREEKQDQPILELLSGYAYNREKIAEKEILAGEGLVGQAFRNGMVNLVRNIPQEYVTRVGSGFGEARPNALLIIPLKINEQVYGVIELATFGEFYPHHLEFVSKLADNIASELFKMQTNITTRKLLEDSQKQTLNLRSKEEEMRGKNDELEAAQELMKLKQAELEKTLEKSRQQALELQNKEQDLSHSQEILQNIIDNIPKAIFWKDPQLNYLGCNKIFAQVATLSNSEEIVGKSDFEMPWTTEEAHAYRADDQSVMDAKQAKLNIEESQTLEDGTLTWLNTSKVPLFDKNGTLLGVLGMFEDVSQRKQEVETLKQKIKESEIMDKRFAEQLNQLNEYEMENIKLKEELKQLKRMNEKSTSG